MLFLMVIILLHNILAINLEDNVKETLRINK